MVSVEDEFKYTGLHAFIFINELDPGTNIRTVIHSLRDFGPPPTGPWSSLRKRSGARWASHTSGWTIRMTSAACRI